MLGCGRERGRERGRDGEEERRRDRERGREGEREGGREGGKGGGMERRREGEIEREGEGGGRECRACSFLLFHDSHLLLSYSASLRKWFDLHYTTRILLHGQVQVWSGPGSIPHDDSEAMSGRVPFHLQIMFNEDVVQ